MSNEQQLLLHQIFLQSARTNFERHGIIIRIQDGGILYRTKDVVQLSNDDFNVEKMSKFLERIQSARSEYLMRRADAKLFTELYHY